MIELLMAMQVATADIKVPQRFRHENIVLTQYTTPQELAKWCGGKDKRGCHIKTNEGFEMIVVLNPCYYADVEKFARDVCHEVGHVNGWGEDHGR